MLTAPCAPRPTATDILTEAVRAAVESTFSAIWGEKPVPSPIGEDASPSTCVAGIISFTGDVSWSLSWVLTLESAPALIQGFTGFEIGFDSPDMGDAVAELVNVLAGDVVAQLEARRVKAKMTLPIVARGCPLQLMASRNSKVVRLDYSSKLGKFWFGLVSSAG